MKSTSSVVLPLAGILGVGALIYIYYRQRDKDKRRKNDDSNGISVLDDTIETLEFNVSNVQVPLIVGRNSVTLKSIEEKTSTKIRFREGENENQICTIKGKANNVKLAKELVDAEGAKPSVITEEVLVSTSSCGRIEGFGGTILQDICQKSSAKVWIDPGTRKVQGENRRVLITGTKEQVDIAKKLIEEKIKEQPLDTPPSLQSPRPTSPYSNSSITTTEEPREILLPSPEKLKNNEGQLEVFVSAVSSPSRFWVQLAGPQTTELDFLVDAMTEYYNQKENQELHKIREPYLGQIVAANHLIDSKWYRAEIVAIQPNEMTSSELVLDVYFLDYGDQQFVGRKDILELRADFLSLRFQAIECFLAHVQPLQTGSKFEEWDKKSIETFEDMVQVANWKKLISKVVTYKERKSFALQRHKQRESSPVPGVELYEENSEKSIALELVKKGCAELSDRFGDIAKSSVLIVNEEETKEVEEAEMPEKVVEEVISNLKEDLEPQKEEVVPQNEVTESQNDEIEQKEEIQPQKEEISLPEPQKISDEVLISPKSPTPPPKEEISTPALPSSPPKSEILEESDPIEVPKDAAPPLPVEQINNEPNNNLEPSELSNGKSTKNKQAPSSSDVFGSNNVKPKKKKKQVVADFLAMEQQKSHQDWNQMMDD